MLPLQCFVRVPVLLLCGVVVAGSGCRQLDTRNARNSAPVKSQPEQPQLPEPLSEPMLREQRQPIPPTPASEASHRRSAATLPAGYDEEPLPIPESIRNYDDTESDKPSPAQPPDASEPDGPIAALVDPSGVEFDLLEFVSNLNLPTSTTRTPTVRQPMPPSAPVRVVSLRERVDDWPRNGLPQNLVISPLLRD
uniref:Uncharacterized protein n=1 Tax=Schlesneria paludicola TaxID=360056 RepID=A0A7C2P1C1_9PLAN